jgi:hypothetical protein
MKSIILLLSLMIIPGFLNQAGAAPIDLHNYVTYNAEYNTVWPQQLMNTNLILALSGTNWEVPLLEVEKGDLTAIDPRNTIVANPGNTGRVLFTLWRNNHDTPAPVPEPPILILLGTGLIGLAGYIKANKRSPN